MSPNPEEILSKIKDLPLKDALNLIAAYKIFSVSVKGYEKIRDWIHAKFSEKKWGFVPNEDEDNVLLRISERDYYAEFSKLLPHHQYSDFIRVGYLIAQLNRMGGEHNRTRVRQIRESVSQRPNGGFLIRIVNIVTTGGIVPVVDYLRELKSKKYDQNYISQEFDEIISEWNKYAYFTNSEMGEEEIFKTIKTKMDNSQKLIMIFAFGSATNNTMRAVARILNDGFNKGYFYQSKNNIEGDMPTHTSTFTLI